MLSVLRKGAEALHVPDRETGQSVCAACANRQRHVILHGLFVSAVLWRSSCRPVK